MYILEISECSDYGLAAILSIFKRILNIIHLVVPIILIVTCTVGIIQLVLEPEDKEKKLKKGLITKFTSAIIVYFLPFIIQLILNVIPMAATDGTTYVTFSLGSCWQDAERMQELMDLSEKSTSSTIRPNSSHIALFDDMDSYELNATPKSTGGVLLIAGHSYAPYCSSFPTDNDCREETKKEMSSGYFEATETRKLVKLIEKELKNQGIKVSIANELLGGTKDKLNKSFYLEAKNNTEAFRKIAPSLKNYKYVLEVHFNASTNHTASGASVVYTGSSPTNIDNQIIEAVAKYTNKKAANATNDFYSLEYFNKLSIPITYLETEFYDNKEAMDRYTNNKSNIAKEIAKVIKNNFGSTTSTTINNNNSSNNNKSNNNPRIIIGDSRTEGMCGTTYCNLCSLDKAIYKGSMGYDWFINSAISETSTYLNSNSSKTYNIYILLGVNGLGSTSTIGNQTATKYYNKIKELANGKWKKHNIYFVSVNPVIDSRSQYVKNISINSFNSTIKQNIENSNLSNLKYCDTNSSLKIDASTSHDGVHYTCEAYSNVYNIIKDCN